MRDPRPGTAQGAAVDVETRLRELDRKVPTAEPRVAPSGRLAGRGRRPVGVYPISGGASVPLLYLTVPVLAGRTYEIETSAAAYADAEPWVYGELIVSYLLGAVPLVTSPRLIHTGGPILGAGPYPTVLRAIEFYDAPADGQLGLLTWFYAVNSSRTYGISAAPTRPVQLIVHEQIAAPGDTGSY